MPGIIYLIGKSTLLGCVTLYLLMLCVCRGGVVDVCMILLWAQCCGQYKA